MPVQLNVSFVITHVGNAIPPLNKHILANWQGANQRGNKIQSIVTYSKERVTQDGVAVDEENVHIHEFSPGARAGPQVKPVVDDRQRCLLDLLFHVPHHCRQGRPQANTDDGS